MKQKQDFFVQFSKNPILREAQNKLVQEAAFKAGFTWYNPPKHRKIWPPNEHDRSIGFIVKTKVMDRSRFAEVPDHHGAIEKTVEEALDIFATEKERIFLETVSDPNNLSTSGNFRYEVKFGARPGYILIGGKFYSYDIVRTLCYLDHLDNLMFLDCQHRKIKVDINTLRKILSIIEDE